MTSHLEKTTTEFVDSLLSSKSRHTLCLNIAEPGFEAEQVVKRHLTNHALELHSEPTAPQFDALLAKLGGHVTLVSFKDLDHHPKVLERLLAHVKNEQPGGKLIIVSREWNSDNTERERELRKHCLFFQQNLAKPPKSQQGK